MENTYKINIDKRNKNIFNLIKYIVLIFAFFVIGMMATSENVKAEKINFVTEFSNYGDVEISGEHGTSSFTITMEPKRFSTVRNLSMKVCEYGGETNCLPEKVIRTDSGCLAGLGGIGNKGKVVISLPAQGNISVTKKVCNIDAFSFSSYISNYVDKSKSYRLYINEYAAGWQTAVASWYADLSYLIPPKVEVEFAANTYKRSHEVKIKGTNFDADRACYFFSSTNLYTSLKNVSISPDCKVEYGESPAVAGDRKSVV